MMLRRMARELFRMSFLVLGVSLALVQTRVVIADGPRDNIPGKVRRVPPLGVEVSDTDRQLLEKGLRELGTRIAMIRKHPDAQLRNLLPDVEIYHRAVDNALRYQEFFRAGDVKKGKDVLQAGLDRARLLAEGRLLPPANRAESGDWFEVNFRHFPKRCEISCSLQKMRAR